jgi:uncharacterized membrane protein YbaN (DUF454 family)
LHLWTILGLLCLVLGVIGVAVPLLPTTPFVLLAAACFAKSSPRMHGWLLNSELFGPMLRGWEANRCISYKVKWLALLMMAVVGGVSIWFFVAAGWLRIAGLGFVGVGCLTVLSLKTCPLQKP